jgi:glutamine synthetase
MPKTIDLSEAEAFLAANADASAVDLLVPDGSGIMRGKRLARDGVKKLYSEGVRLPGSIFALDVVGDDVEAAGLRWREGDADRICRPVAGTLRPVPWHPRPLGQVLLTMFEEDGRPFYADPRQVLAGVLERYRADGLRPVVAVELEFYLLDRNPAPDGRPQPPISPATGERERGTQALNLSALAEFDGFFAAVDEAAGAQGLPVEGAVKEASPGQFEVNLKYSDDALAAADQGVLLKRLLRGVAGKAGFDATFMAKPFAEAAGSGLHIHMSLLDAKGRNIFDDGTERGGDSLRHAIGGLKASMPESMAVFAPNANSYRRFQEGSYAPTAPLWGYNNRTVALRVPAGAASARRVEHRLAGADANIYLTLAAVLAGAHDGLKRRLDPGPATTGDGYAASQRSLPESWGEALKAFEAGGILSDYFGDDFRRLYAICRRGERQRFRAQVSALEYEWYLRSI